MELRVQRVEKLTETVVGVWLEATSGKLPGFTAGAHIELHLGDDLMRQYSLCNPSSEPEVYQLAVLIDPESRGGSIAVSKLQVGDTLECSEPNNHFELVEGEGYRLFAAGIGITPIWAMAQQLHQEGKAFTMHYRSRTPEQTALLPELNDAPFNASVQHSYSSEGPFDMEGALANPGANEQLYVCGPQRFIDPVLETAAAKGWRADQLHREYFSADPNANAGENTSFRVRVQATGEEYEIGPDQSIAQVLDDAGHFVPVSCEEGVCGTCMVPVVEGTPDHRDLYMNDAEHAENDMITVCCSRSKTPLLVLDV